MRSLPPAEVVSQLRQADRFLIVGHIDPDPDSIGATLGLRRLLISLGKEAIATAPTPLPPSLSFLPDRAEVCAPDAIDERSWDHLIVVDCGVDRTGEIARHAGRARSIINIDHHATNLGTGTHNWIDSAYAATCEMVAALAESLGARVDQDTATLLYCGLVGDTGWFRFSNTSPAVLRLAADLLTQGVDIGRINRYLNEYHALSHLRLLGRMLGTLRTACDGRVLYARVTRQMRRDAEATRADGDGFVQVLRMVRGVDVVVLFDELDDGQIRVQLRSSPPVDVSEIARGLGGGGHARAAGIRLTGSIDEVERKVLAEVARYVGTYEKESE